MKAKKCMNCKYSGGRFICGRDKIPSVHCENLGVVFNPATKESVSPWETLRSIFDSCKLFKAK